MKSRLLTTLKYVIFSGTAIVLLYLVFYKTDFHKLGENLVKANYWWVGVSLLLALLGYFVRAYRWNLLIEPLGYKPKLTNSYHAVMLGYFANIAIPRIGELSRCGALNKTDKVPVDKLFATVIVERSVDLLTLLFLLGILLVAKFSFFGSFFDQSIVEPLLNKFEIKQIPIIIIVLVFFFISTLLFLIFYFRDFLKRIKPFAKTYNFAKGILLGLVSVKDMKQKWLFIFLSLLLWFIYWMMTYVVFFAIPATSHLTMIDGLFLLVAGGLGQAAPVQNGFGVFHGIVASALTLYGLDFNSEGLLYAIINHESQTLFTILLGLSSFVYIFFVSRKNRAK